MATTTIDRTHPAPPARFARLMVLGYLAFVNLLSGLLFWKDKRAAKNGSWRVPEARLHLLELLGGVFCNWVLMYAIRHKNRKISYYAITYLLLIAWIAALIYFPRIVQ